MDNDNQSVSSAYFPSNPLLFRFTFVFIVLFTLLFNNGTLILLSPQPLLKIDALLVSANWVANHIFQDDRTITYGFGGSGDTSFHWYTLFIVLMLSLIGTLVWSIFAKGTKNYNKLYYLLTVIVRYYIGLMMIQYGIAKLYQSQFPFPFHLTLVSPLYNMHPMTLAWTFFGASYGYNIFIGIVEVLGVLLLFRKTATLGALITLATSLNVMAINYFYNVPVKMVSTALVLFCLFLLAPNIQRLFAFLCQGKSTSLVSLPNLSISSKIGRVSVRSIKYLLIVITVGVSLSSKNNSSEIRNAFNDPESELYGAFYITDKEQKNKNLIGISENWQKFIFMTDTKLIIQNYESKSTDYQIIVDRKKKEVKIVAKYGERGIHATYKKGNNGNIILTTLNSETPITLELTKIDLDNIPLHTQKFNWVRGDI